MVGPGGGEREELVERSPGVAVQVPTDEAPPQSPMPVTFVAIAPLLQHWLGRGRREGRQRRRREGGAAAAATGSHPPAADVLQPSSPLQSGDVVLPPHFPPQGRSQQSGRREQSRRLRGGAGLCEGRWRPSLAGGRECVPGGLRSQGKRGAAVLAAKLAAPLQLVWEREGFLIYRAHAPAELSPATPRLLGPRDPHTERGAARKKNRRSTSTLGSPAQVSHPTSPRATLRL